MLRFRLCPVTVDDAPQLREIDRGCFSPEIAYSEREIRNIMRSEPGGPHWGAVLDDGRLAGFILTRMLVRGHGPGRRYGHVITLDVRSGYRDRGVGSALMRAAEDHYRVCGCDGMRLEVSVDNAAAARFYARRGYRLLRRLPHYYRRGEDGLLLQREFADGGPHPGVGGPSSP